VGLPLRKNYKINNPLRHGAAQNRGVARTQATLTAPKPSSCFYLFAPAESSICVGYSDKTLTVSGK